MPHQLEDAFVARLMANLRRRAITTASRWAATYRILDGKPWQGDRYPWTIEMHDSTAEWNVCQKGAQMGVTETMLDIGFFWNDVKGKDVLYVLPKKTPEATDFSKARFDAAVATSPHLKSIYSEANVGHKRCGAANFYIRGGQSRSGLKSVPVSVLILDELEEMPDEVVPLAEERTSGQVEKLIWALSTPMLNNSGINKLFLTSSQDHYFFPCPCCSVSAGGPVRPKMIELTFPDCLEIVGDDPDLEIVSTSRLKCPDCNGTIKHEDKPEIFRRATWIPSVHGRERRGFHVNQLYSTTVSPGKIAAAFLRSHHDPAAEQEFYNSKLALPHEPTGTSITRQEIDACLSDHLNGKTEPHNNRVVTMGVDVGKWLHYEVCEWDLGAATGNDVNSNSFPRVLEAGKIRSETFDPLDDIMLRYRVNSCVIDAHPERREAFRFSQRFCGIVKMCIYGRGVTGKQVHEQKSDLGEPLITVDRTSWLDQALGRFRKGTIRLPVDTSFEYREHLAAVARIWRRDADGNPVGQYVCRSGEQDHHAHSRCYAEIALALSATGCQTTSIESPF